MKKLSGGFWAVLAGGLLPFMFPTAPWAALPGEAAGRLFFPKGLGGVDSDLAIVGAFLLVIMVNGLAWGGAVYLLARVALGRWFAERA